MFSRTFFTKFSDILLNSNIEHTTTNFLIQKQWCLNNTAKFYCEKLPKTDEKSKGDWLNYVTRGKDLKFSAKTKNALAATTNLIKLAKNSNEYEIAKEMWAELLKAAIQESKIAAVKSKTAIVEMYNHLLEDLKNKRKPKSG